MSTIQPGIDSSSTWSEWLADALGLVQRVNARVHQARESRAPSPRLRHGRLVLNDRRCLYLAGLAGEDEVA
jgi:hypothetical protein